MYFILTVVAVRAAYHTELAPRLGCGLSHLRGAKYYRSAEVGKGASAPRSIENMRCSGFAGASSSKSYYVVDRPGRSCSSSSGGRWPKVAPASPVCALHPRIVGLSTFPPSLPRHTGPGEIRSSGVSARKLTADTRQPCLIASVSRRQVLLHAIAAESFPASTLLNFQSISKSEPLGQIGHHPEDPPTFVKASGRIIASKFCFTARSLLVDVH